MKSLKSFPVRSFVCLCVAVGALPASSLFAGSGIFKDYVVVDAGAGNTFYNLNGGVGTNWNGLNLGSINAASGTLTLNGFEVNTYKNSGDDITGAFGNYRIYKQGSTAPSFTETGVPFNSNLVNAGDQKWQSVGQNTNLMAGPLDVGTYKVEVFTRASGVNNGNGFSVFSNNGGANYTATFTVPVSSFTFSGATGSGTTSAGTGWTNTRQPGNGHDLHFASTVATSLTNTLSSVNSLTFDSGAGAITLGSGSLSVAAGITNNSASSQSVNSNLTLSAPQSFTANSGALSFGGSSIDNGGNLLSVAGASATSISNVISGSGGLSKSGAGVLTLSGNNGYSGATSITAGKVKVTGNNALGSAAAGTTVSSGAAVELNNVNYTTAEPLTINGTGISNGGALVNSGTSSYAGQITAATNAKINAGGGTLTLTGGVVKNGTTLTIAGGGRVNINTTGISGASANSDLVIDGTTVATSVASTYNGPTTVQNSGTLIVNNASGSATGTGNVTVDSTSTLSGTGKIDSGANLISINGALVVGDSSLGSPVASVLELKTSGGGSTTLGATAKLYIDLFANAGDNTSNTSAADRLRLFGSASVDSLASLYVSDSTGSMSFALGNKWIIGDLASATLTSTFVDSKINGPTLASGLHWHAEQSGTDWMLSIAPEPSRALLLGFGLTGMLIRRRRK